MSKQKPSLSKYPSNHAFSWQRLRWWILLAGLILHIVQMQFNGLSDLRQKKASYVTTMSLVTKVDMDPGLYRVASRLQAHLYNEQQVQNEILNLLIHGQKADASITYDSSNSIACPGIYAE